MPPGGQGPGIYEYGPCSDSGRWDALEIYFEQHTDVEFTHGICPECAASFFDSEEPA